CVAVRRAYNNGIVVVVAAGNDGQVGTGFGTIDSPGNEPNVITVGAMDDRNTAGTDDDVLAPYSSKGPTLVDHIAKPDLVAPGTHIVSLRVAGSYLDTNYHNFTLKLGDYRNDTSTSNKDGFYYDLSGTSMAAPMVSATAALMLQKEPTLNPASVTTWSSRPARATSTWTAPSRQPATPPPLPRRSPCWPAMAASTCRACPSSGAVSPPTASSGASARAPRTASPRPASPIRSPRATGWSGASAPATAPSSRTPRSPPRVSSGASTPARSSGAAPATPSTARGPSGTAIIKLT
ncbi:MAG: hypothetical protein DMF50_04455, partial [Acidobacteria bacterium]